VSRASCKSAVSLLAAALLLCTGAAADEPVLRFPAGAEFFQKNCAVCHRANGTGNPGLAPPLTGYPAAYVRHPQGRRQLVLTVLYGMYGEVLVDERHYNFKMPDFARFDDATLAAVLNFIAFDLGHAAPETPPLVPAEVAAERALALGGDAVRRHRLEVLDAVHP
jgi:mono/diheme cytochrome c family protein